MIQGGVRSLRCHAELWRCQEGARPLLPDDDPLEALYKTPDRDAPLVSHAGNTLSVGAFTECVETWATALRQTELSPRGHFAVIATQEPLEFFALLFALWSRDVRVILPNRDFFEGTRPFDYHAHVVSLRHGRPHVEANPGHRPIACPEPGDTVAFSSGSTGRPKGILHSRANFIQNARATAAQMPSVRVHSLTFLKPYLVSAVSHFLVHLLTNSHLRFLDFKEVGQIPGLSLGDPAMGVVGSPVHVMGSLGHLAANAKPRLIFSSGDALCRTAIAGVFERYPETTCVCAYGLAELAGRFFLNVLHAGDPPERFETLGCHLDHARYRLEDRHMLAAAPFMFKGYLIDGSFTPTSPWHDSGDLAVDGETGLRLLGRSNEEIKVLGNKIHLKDLETRIKNLLDQDRLVVVSKTHPAFGVYLCLIVQERVGTTRSVIVDRLRSGLKQYEMPHAYLAIDEFPFTQTMKIDRRAIAGRIDALRPLS